MNSRSLCMAVILFVPLAASGQESKEDKGFSLTGLGFGFGYHNLFNEGHIGENLGESALADFFLARKLTLNARIDHVAAGGPQENERFSWREVSLGVAVFHQVSQVSALGLGLGADWMNYHRYSWMPSWISKLDPMTGEYRPELAPQYDIRWIRVCPSVSALAKTDWCLEQGSRVTMQVFYKFSFPGRPYGRSPLNSLNTIGFMIAFIHGLQG
jgi:hypothetical protein